MVGNVDVVVSKELQPLALLAVQVLLREDVVQVLLIGEKLEGHSIPIVSLYTQGEHNYCKLQIVCMIVLFINF